MVIPINVPPVTVMFPEYKFVILDVMVVRFDNPVILPPVTCALAVTKLVMFAAVAVKLVVDTTPINVPALTVVATMLPLTLPVSVPLKVVATTLPVTFPKSLPVTSPTMFVVNVGLDMRLLRVRPALITGKPVIAVAGVNVASLLKVATIVSPNWIWIISCVTPFVMPSFTVFGIAPLMPCCLVYCGPINLNEPLSYNEVWFVLVLNQISPFFDCAGWILAFVIPATGKYP